MASESVLALSVCPDFSERYCCLEIETETNSFLSDAFGHGVFITAIEKQLKHVFTREISIDGCSSAIFNAESPVEVSPVFIQRFSMAGSHHTEELEHCSQTTGPTIIDCGIWNMLPIVIMP